ncbi:KilA-N domain-containing protein [Pasteurella multocida]
MIFLYLKFVLLSLSANLGKKRDRQFNSMIGSVRNTIPQGNNSASLNTGFELPITLIKLGNFSQKEMFIMSNLSILNTSIRTLDNLYSLNDLHKASGNDPKHRPSLFARNEQTRELVEQINSENNRSTKVIFALKSIRGGADISKQGTWACEELVLSYAMWISPKFHLIVLRAFLAMHRGEVKPQQLALPEPKPRGILLDEEAFYVVAKAIAKLNESTFEWEKIMDLFSELESHRNYKTAFNLGVASYNLAQSSEKIIMKNLVQMRNKVWKKEIEDFIFSNPHLQNHTENKLVHYLR